ncbi:LysR family transcriptional regulator [Vibrio coralliilyticus]|uniref:LysR family transcriptional regulator n=1 Tax=Vibrio coralliilyticus TaxID=190893 RepID=UPI00155FDD21|nr:LysR family transcriptional regulator [Vibrio coralliilyticus]NRF53795.1 LysR family transcriptional regulator [Vibrio coralliilyticus]NRG03825.1 LysR family transcriptional regulator [Vibrio coralliilyticus]
MKEFNWKGIDLNLLVAFQALYNTQSVSLAAQQCYVSQSAMSHTLQRLRALFDDPLFERIGTRMEPTQRSHDMAPVVHNLLASIKNDLLTKQHFVPQEYSGTWKIGLTDYAEQLFAAPLYDAIKRHSPLSQISFYNVNRSNYQDIADSEHLDMVIGSITNHGSRYLSQRLYTEQHLCLYDPQCFEVELPMTLEQFVSVEHALVSPDGNLQTQVDERLAKLGLQRRVGVASRNFLTIRRLLIGRKLICIVPKRFAEMEMYSHSLQAVEPPIEVPDFEIKMLFLKALNSDEKNTWVRHVVAETIC